MTEGATPDLARAVLDALIEGCQVIGPDWKYRYVNATAARQGQRRPDELVGRSMSDCYPGIDATPMFTVLRRCMAERKPETMLNEFTLPDGTLGWFELHFMPSPEGVCILSLDVTDRKRTEAALRRSEEQLRHAQKMEAVGRLAGGISHDFNNMLSVVLSYTELILGGLATDSPIHADLVEIRKAGERAAELTRQLLTFSRQQVLSPAVLDVNQVIRGMDKMISRLLGAHVEVTFLTQSGVGKVRADPGSLEQMLMNLVVNAGDAMPTGGKLTVQTKNVELDEEYARDHHDVTPGSYVMIAITDTGIGMDKATQARAFDPFFTTKDRGKGTGLGLAGVFGVVKRCGGHIWMYSEVGQGTSFKVYLPRTDAPLSMPSKPPLFRAATTGSETILLVEDDEQVRAVAVGILRRAGYFVLESPSADEAVLTSQRHGAKVDLLLSDVVLPRMSGPELAGRLRTTRPHMQVLFMSGYTGESVVQHGILDSNASFIQKPLTPDALLQKVRETLNSPAVAPA